MSHCQQRDGLHSGAIADANESLRMATTQFGNISLSELLQLRRDWAAVELSYLESLRDVMQAWAALSPYVGPQ